MNDRDVHVEEQEPVHDWFGLSYAAYLVIPRSVLQSLPMPLQAQLVDALRAIREHLEPALIPVRGSYRVKLRNEWGRWVADPLRDYERGRRRVTKDELLALMDREPEVLR